MDLFSFDPLPSCCNEATLWLIREMSERGREMRAFCQTHPSSALSAKTRRRYAWGDGGVQTTEWSNRMLFEVEVFWMLHQMSYWKQKEIPQRSYTIIPFRHIILLHHSAIGRGRCAVETERISPFLQTCECGGGSACIGVILIRCKNKKTYHFYIQVLPVRNTGVRLPHVRFGGVSNKSCGWFKISVKLVYFLVRMKSFLWMNFF